MNSLMILLVVIPVGLGAVFAHRPQVSDARWDAGAQQLYAAALLIVMAAFWMLWALLF